MSEQKSSKETRVDPDYFLVSKTDLKGRITYANRAFMVVSGFPEQVLLGHPHNVIRHSDMPRGVFRLLWESVVEGNEFFGFIKNRTADGGFYWVFADVTPDRNPSGELVGYHSVRRAPREEGVRTMAALYEEMRRIEADQTSQTAPEASRDWLLEQAREAGHACYRDWVLELQSGCDLRRTA
ncbi:MAG: PAS domain-containing protein [Pseudomonadota bacterium]